MTDLELTSRHEVGHALVAQSLSEPCLGVSIVADKYSLGRTHTGRRRPVLHEIMILFAGGIAEFESDPSLYGYRAIECDAEDVARLLDADPLRIQTAMHGLIVAQKPPDQHKEILTESYRLAVNVLTKEWTTVCRLADHLCAVRSMDFYDVQKFWKEKART
jgi:ATP-dependent Zn protease